MIPLLQPNIRSFHIHFYPHVVVVVMVVRCLQLWSDLQSGFNNTIIESVNPIVHQVQLHPRLSLL